MRKASTNLIRPSSGTSSTALSSGSNGTFRTVAQPESSSSKRHHDNDGSSSSCNDSLDSGQHSPMSRSESAIELRGRKLVNGKAAMFRKSLPSQQQMLGATNGEEDSDGNNADNDSVNSGISGASFLHGMSKHDIMMLLVTGSLLYQYLLNSTSTVQKVPINGKNQWYLKCF